VKSVVLDPSQAAVVALQETACAAVIGAPGSGKTTTLIELVADRVLVRGYTPSEVLALTPTRGSATRLRDALALRLGLATNGPLARTVNSLAHEIVGAAARDSGVAAPREGTRRRAPGQHGRRCWAPTFVVCVVSAPSCAS
jgi:superfamily I DNA/RNA helicase